MITRLMIEFASKIWLSRTELITTMKQLESLRSVFCFAITVAIKTTSTSVLVVILDIPPLQIIIKKIAAAEIYRYYFPGSNLHFVEEIIFHETI